MQVLSPIMVWHLDYRLLLWYNPEFNTCESKKWLQAQ